MLIMQILFYPFYQFVQVSVLKQDMLIESLKKSTIYARLMNQYKFKNLILFPARFYKIFEEDRGSDDNRKLTESDSNDINIQYQLKHQIQIQETKDSGWIFDKINSMKISF